MNGIMPGNPMLVPSVFPHMPGMPGSYVPPWLVSQLPQEMIYPAIPQPQNYIPIEQLATTPPYYMPLYNRPFIPQPVLTNPNAQYELPPMPGNSWLA